jgi:hypothetical protein
VGWWPAGAKGGEILFFKLFSNQIFSIQIKTKTLQTFSQNFINFLNFTQATKIHAKTNNDAQTLVVSRLIKLN